MANLKPVCIVVTFPSDMEVSEDRMRWYMDHAIRGYWRQFASDTDPIRGMSRCSLSVEPLKQFAAEAALAAIDAVAPAVAPAAAEGGRDEC